MTTTSCDIHSTDYRPSNVRVVVVPEGTVYGAEYKFHVLDFDGRGIGWFKSYADAESCRKQRAGVIKAALTRRVNKARAAKAGA